MHHAIGWGFAIVIALFVYQGIKDRGQEDLQTPAAIAHDAPIVAKEIKRALPALKEQAEEAGKKAGPKLKDAVDEFKNDSERKN